MDFIAVLDFLLGVFEREKVDFAFIGGFALQAAGVSRATKDLDFMVLAEDGARIKPIMTERGYELLTETPEFLCFIGKTPALGRVDFLLAHRKYSLEMLKNALSVEGFGGKYRYKVVRPEDIIGLKVQAIANDPQRRLQDWPDIQKLLEVHREKMNMVLVRKYFEIFGMEAELDSLLKGGAHEPHL
jgi:hypothetical protein